MKTMCGGLFSFCFPYETVFGNGQVAITHNVFGFGEEADLTAHKMKVAQIFNTPQQLHSSTSAAFLPNPCYAYVWRLFITNVNLKTKQKK